MMNNRGPFNGVKHAKAFCRKHFKGSELQEVNHPQECYCSTTIWGGRAKDAYIQIVKADLQLFWAQL
jgi:hypothetical protein